MKSAHPDIKLSAAALRYSWSTLPLLKAAGEHLDYISIHTYWFLLFVVNFNPGYLACMMRSEGPEKILNKYVGVLEKSGYRGRIKIAWDEWNLRSWHHPGFPRKSVQDYNNPRVRKLVKTREKNDLNHQYTMADALFTASFFNACLRHAEDVGMTNIAALVNTRGPLYVYPGGVVRRTHFHAMAMYRSELEERVRVAEIKCDRLRHRLRSVPVVDAVATANQADSRYSIALVNRHPSKPVACHLQIGDRILEGEYTAVVLTGDSPDAYNDVEFAERVSPKQEVITFEKGITQLPPHSLVIVKCIGK